MTEEASTTTREKCTEKFVVGSSDHSRCRSFYQKGKCRFGESCKFSHQTPPQHLVAAPAAATDYAQSTQVHIKTPCKFYFENGRCRFGASCKFSHNSSSQPCLVGDLQCLTEAFQNIGFSQPHPPPPPRSVVVKTSPSGPKKLYMDALNYGGLFFPVRSKWNLKRSLGTVRRFVTAAKKSGWVLKVFFDDWTSSSEADNKWRKRREKEVLEGYRNMPQGLSSLFGDMFRQCGVEVAYASFMDCDDTIAYHAEHDGATVLSGDSDMFRYTGSTYPIFEKYEYTYNNRNTQETIRLLENLKQHGKGRPTRASSRPILPPPDTAPRSLFVKNNAYLRGAPSPLLRKLNLINPHAVISPLRHAMYHALKMIRATPAAPAALPPSATGNDEFNGTFIEEEWPTWSEEQGMVIWEKSKVNMAAAEAAYSQYGDLLCNPRAAFETFFPVESDVHNNIDNYVPSGVLTGDWFKHCFACRSVTMEICSIMMDTTLLELMM